jgi:hypothetical protein
MFTQAGHRVSRWHAMSPSLAEADVIVWVPDDFDAPRAEAIDWLDDWLATNPNRLLVFVGRDFDATPRYWTKALPQAPPPLKAEFGQRLREAQEYVAANRAVPLSRTTWPDLFRLDASAPPAKVSALQGPWAQGIDASQVEIERHTRLRAASSGDTLLATGEGDALVTQFAYANYWGTNSSRVLLVENGSWLLNLPLVNHEHRKLAGKLIAAAGPPSQRVVFLESSAQGPIVTAEDPTLNPPSGFGLFGVWPIGIMLAQLTMLGIFYAFSQWPIMGRPSDGERPSLTDFGRHIRALGRLLRESGDRSYAIATVARYRQLVKGKSIDTADEAKSIE